MNLNRHISHLQIDHVEVRHFEINSDGVQYIHKYVMGAMHATSEVIKFYLWSFCRRSAPNYSY